MQFRTGRGARRPGAWLLAACVLGTSAPAQADTGSLAVSAVVLSRSVCRFLTGPTTLDFGTINPATTSAASASTTLRFWCFGTTGSTTYSVQMGNGLNSPSAGLRRVRHATVGTEYMQYALSVTPASGTLPWLATQTITFNGTIAASEFQNARAGSYSDTVVIDIDP